MAITTSAKKAIRVSDRKRVFNIRRKRVMEDLIKEIRILAQKKDKKGFETMLPQTVQAIDKAAKTKYIKKNTASRYKSRLAALLKKISA